MVISNIQKIYAAEYYKIQFVTCSAKAVERAERKKIMKNERQKQNYEAVELSKQRMLSKKRARDTADKLELQKKLAKQCKTMNAAKKEELLQKQKQKYCSNES